MFSQIGRSLNVIHFLSDSQFWAGSSTQLDTEYLSVVTRGEGFHLSYSCSTLG
jgi:hypothetical protein